MKYCNIIWLTSVRSESPATDQTLLTNAPIVQFPGCINDTTEGPIPNLPCPSTRLVAVGNWNTGPTPQVSLLDFAGERKNVGVMSPKPNTPAVFCTSVAEKNAGVSSSIPKTSRFCVPGAGCQMIGAIQRMIRFQSLLTPTGTTG